VQLSTIPTLVEDGMRPRHADLRPFAVNDGNEVWVLPGGLTRVALPEGELVVNSSQGGGSKDTWVLDGDPATAQLGVQRVRAAAGDVGSLVAHQATSAAQAASARPTTADSSTATPEPARHRPEASPQDEDAPIRQQQQQQQQQRVDRGGA
jgi:hypothetical protein